MTSSPLIDSHCHIVFPNFEDDLEEVAARWRAVGVKSLLHACVEPSEIPAIKALADRFPELRYSVGVHPLDTKHWRGIETIDVLRKAALQDSRVVAIGELGLDLFKDSNLEEQLAVLRPQLDLAFELDLPVIVHCRDAATPMISLLQELKELGRLVKGVMHCWGGDVHEMEKFLSFGFYISFSGTVTFPKATKIHECALKVPEDRFLIETDCPFLAPVPKRGKRNEPSYVEAVASKVADIRGESFAFVAERSTSNARLLFGLP
ncbi:MULTISPECIES: TatD family hydrolase [Prochlorococcus]|uniref:D-aminoacyl-tRNA deacylase n=1 Tax=Prochlorococcus marinus (strain SARG / CCMP1375 / SS120) TaxID=167539 RepID=Q7VA28_PROMA|nr:MULTISPECIES: TatD family hydrolase [Prochlorococcus]AAQ00685.1 Mg-dependent DNase [Prochlorococcus marinus subsp. marinus str. CCMP1375]KGG10820.1 putative deoxyribonuclease YcfH [Prochlorococcus marinus str. LG]KGG20398.1 putative deoxyribonuclease YcfH [Prochlorococcus marinus str. SS2]KGG24067.1 putative deoxyribonuclease YcfH [Prochlorococcus marinus str. SS35]KGG31674.1 putative deoxyribonuclease YcfH [Prochlorococcus marinus str. SS51]